MLSRLETGPLVKMVCIEGWANARGGPQVMTATNRETTSRGIAAGHCMAEAQPKQLKGCCRFTLLKTQDVKAVTRPGGHCDNELAIDHNGIIRHGGPYDWRRDRKSTRLNSSHL